MLIDATQFHMREGNAKKFHRDQVGCLYFKVW